MGSSGGGGGGGGGISPAGAVIGGIGSIAQGVSTDIGTFITNFMNYQQRQQAMGYLNDIGPQSQGAQSLLALAGQHIGDIQSHAAGVMPQWNAMVNNDLMNAGAQERKDINTQFDNAGAAQNAGLTQRGLSATTVQPTMQAGLERQRADALGGLDERLRQQRFGADVQGFNIDQANYANTFNQVWGLQQLPYQFSVDDAMRRLNLLSGFNNIPPDQGLSAQVTHGLGSLGVKPPQATNPNLIGPAALGAGSNVLSSLGTAAILTA